jgi:hypothetical protein
VCGHLYAAKRRKPRANGCGEVALPRRFTIQGGPKDIPRLVLHRTAVNSRLNAQAGFQRVVQVANGNARHAVTSIIIDVDLIIDGMTCQPETGNALEYLPPTQRQNQEENATLS